MNGKLLSISEITMTPNSAFIASGNVICYSIGNLAFTTFEEITFKTDYAATWEDALIWTSNKGFIYELFTLYSYENSKNNALFHSNGKNIYLHHSSVYTGIRYFGTVMFILQ